MKRFALHAPGRKRRHEDQGRRTRPHGRTTTLWHKQTVAHRRGRGGTTVTSGLPPPGAALALPLVQLVAEGSTVKGSYIGTCVPTRDIPRYIALYCAGRLPVDRLMSGILPLDDINEGFDRLHKGQAVRQVIEFA